MDSYLEMQDQVRLFLNVTPFWRQLSKYALAGVMASLPNPWICQRVEEVRQEIYRDVG
jgi:hypothetical protein